MAIPEEAKLVFEGKMFQVWQWDQPMFDGSVQKYETIKRPNTVEVIAGTPDGKVLLLEQEQPHKDGSFISLPGGRVEPGESPDDAVRRELREETGFEAESFELYRSWRPSGSLEWEVFVYFARGARHAGPQNLDPGERIRVMELPFDAFLEEANKETFRHFLIKSDLVRAKYDPAFKEVWKKRLF
jgi:ADP-ribose pyrophosphatase